MKKEIQRLEPSCNLATVKDGRGGIFTYYPKDPIVEFNYVFIKSSKIRGNHCHPEFDEYFLLTSGTGVMVMEKEGFVYLNKGQSTYHPSNAMHVFYAITDCEAVVLITKKWDDCAQPIIHENLNMGTGDHGDPNYKGAK